MQQLEQGIKEWADGKWPARTLGSRLRKLGEEVGELAEAGCDRTERLGYCTMDERHAATLVMVREAADCAIVLSDICSMLGYSLSAVMRDKFAEVQARPGAGELKGGPPTCPNCLGEIVQDVNGIGHCICGNKPWYPVGNMAPSVRVQAMLNNGCPKCGGVVVLGQCECGFVNGYDRTALMKDGTHCDHRPVRSSRGNYLVRVACLYATDAAGAAVTATCP